uniref:Uncharacterized protein RTL10 n=1 Tax=Avian adenovirus 8 (strain ATCC A-2A) TaxID=66295 RepID=Q9YYR0_ADEG8|nr:unknown [Fowl aviadenovirus 8]
MRSGVFEMPPSTEVYSPSPLPRKSPLPPPPRWYSGPPPYPGFLEFRRRTRSLPVPRTARLYGRERRSLPTAGVALRLLWSSRRAFSEPYRQSDGIDKDGSP